MTRTKSLRLPLCNADGIRGKKQELDYFHGQHVIDVCLLTETHLRLGYIFRLANYICHRNDQLTEGSETAIRVRRGMEYHAVPVQGLEYLESTSIQVMMAHKPVKILAVCHPPGP